MSPSLLLATATVAPLASWDAVVVGAAVAAVPDPSSSPPPQAVRARVRAARSAALANTFLMAKPPGLLAGPTGRHAARPDGQPPVPADGSPCLVSLAAGAGSAWVPCDDHGWRCSCWWVPARA